MKNKPTPVLKKKSKDKNKPTVNNQEPKIMKDLTKASKKERSILKKKNDEKVRKSLKRTKISRAIAYGMFSHVGNDTVSEACEYLGYQISRGAMRPCPQCRESKVNK